jgi:FkbM family methyltransferase
LQHNGCNKVRLDGSALGGGTRESEFWVNPIAHARSSLYQSRVTNPFLYGRSATNVTFQHRQVDVVALDEWLQTVQGEFDLLKMDCEGSEWEILDAAPTAFTRFSNIVAEIHDDPMGKYKREDFAAVLREYGFTTVDFSGLYIGRRS